MRGFGEGHGFSRAVWLQNQPGFSH